MVVVVVVLVVVVVVVVAGVVVVAYAKYSWERDLKCMTAQSGTVQLGIKVHSLFSRL